MKKVLTIIKDSINVIIMIPIILLVIFIFWVFRFDIQDHSEYDNGEEW